MTPKEKAEELVDIYEDRCPQYIKKNTAIWCALIAVDEIIDNLPLISDIQDYWQEVKQEIEKL
jgi:hypothetical protein